MLWNVLANGHSRDYLENRLTLALDIAPAFTLARGADFQELTSFVSLDWRRRMLDAQLELRLRSWVGTNWLELEHARFDVRGALAYNLLWVGPSVRQGGGTRGIVTFGVDFGLDVSGIRGSPLWPFYTRVTFPPDDDFLADNYVTLTAVAFAETSLPELPVF